MLDMAFLFDKCTAYSFQRLCVITLGDQVNLTRLYISSPCGVECPTVLREEIFLPHHQGVWLVCQSVKVLSEQFKISTTDRLVWEIHQARKFIGTEIISSSGVSADGILKSQNCPPR